jgi:hypothetical protein
VRAVPESGLIISARDSGLAIELLGRGGNALVEVKVMSEPEALRLLGQMCSPPDDSLSDDDAKALAKACGYLPVALKALGAMVDTQSGRTWSSVRGDFAERKLRMLEGNVEDYEKIVECALGFSVDALDPAHRRRYLLLALLAYPDMPIDEMEAAELWEAAENCPLVLSKLDAEQACAFLARIGVPESAVQRFREQKLDGRAFSELTDSILERYGMDFGRQRTLEQIANACENGVVWNQLMNLPPISETLDVLQSKSLILSRHSKQSQNDETGQSSSRHRLVRLYRSLVRTPTPVMKPHARTRGGCYFKQSPSS